MNEMRKNVSEEKLNEYVTTLRKMLDLKTVFKEDGSNDEEFKKFNEVIASSFPTIHERCEKLVFGSGCFVYVLKGNKAKKTIMLMSHHDVVDATDGWDSYAFKSEIRNGAIYARGSIDTKTPLFAELEAIEELLKEGYDLNNLNIYIGSSNNEEVCGDGMVKAVEYFKKEKIHFDVVLDEGGAITSGMMPGYDGKSAMIAVHEKSRHIFKCSTNLKIKGHGGLSPNDDNCLDRLVAFINEVNNSRIYVDKFYPEVKATFKTHAPKMKMPMKFLFNNLEIFGPIIKKVMKNIPPAKAMLSTSITFTTIKGGDCDNPQIKAKEAECTMFIRCIREADMETGLNKIKAIGDKYGVSIAMIERDYCEPSSFEDDNYRILKAVMDENFKDVVTAPFLLTAGTDARRFSDIANSILRFAPIDLNPEQFKSIHGDNEHIYITNVGECVCFYKDFVKRIGE